jgi:DNA-binding PadR family transcriptional regulator
MPNVTRITHSTAIVLLAVNGGLRHGFDIIDATGLRSGTVYPILRRLEEAGILRSRWEPAIIAREQQRPPRRYYEVTGSGAHAVREALTRYPTVGRGLGRRGGAPHPAPA